MPYQVISADGACLYRGNDLELACDIHDHVPAARLTVLPNTWRGRGRPVERPDPACRGDRPFDRRTTSHRHVPFAPQV